MKEIKHQFMTFRNGVVADTLRKAGMPYGVIFGLQLPQLAEIARMLTPSAELARRLFADRNVRESRLLAMWLFPSAELTETEAEEMAADMQTREECDIFAFRLLRHEPYAGALRERLKASCNPMQRYLAEAIARFND